MVQLAVILIPVLERRTMVAYESLRPIARSRLLRQWGLGMLSRQTAGLLLSALFWMPAWLIAHRGQSIASFFVWGSFLVAARLLHSALMILLRTIGSEVFQGVVGIVGSLVYLMGMSVFAGLLAEFAIPSIVVATAAVLAAAGMALLRLGYRRWLVADLE